MESAGTKPPEEPAPLRLLKQLTRPRVFIVLAFGSAVLTQIVTWNALPDCHDKRVKDTLSEIFNERKTDVLHYDEFNTISKKEDEILCSARLTLQGNSQISISYKLLKPDNRLIVTELNPI